MPSPSLALDPTVWRTAPAHLDWPASPPVPTVDIWRGIVDGSQAGLQDFWRVLSQDERQRAQRFRASQHQNRFVAAHGMLRCILARYGNQAPEKLVFARGPCGKPYLVSDDSRPSIFFNISHSGDLALFAVSSEIEVGIDLEKDRPSLSYDKIALRIMNAEEQAQFFTLPVQQRLPAFLACWTRKEAFVKAKAEGLQFPLNQVTVSFLPGQPAKILGIQGQQADARPWDMKEIFPGPGYTAALVTAGPAQILRCWQWTSP